MPGLDGFQALESVDRAALDRARECIRMRATDECYRDQSAEFIQEIREKNSYTTRFFVQKKKKVVHVKADDVGWIAAAGTYAVVHARGRDHLLRESLAGLEKKLDPREFVRVNRSTIINLDFVKEIQPFFHGEFVVVLKNDQREAVTRTYRAKFAQILGRA